MTTLPLSRSPDALPDREPIAYWTLRQGLFTMLLDGGKGFVWEAVPDDQTAAWKRLGFREAASSPDPRRITVGYAIGPAVRATEYTSTGHVVGTSRRISVETLSPDVHAAIREDRSFFSPCLYLINKPPARLREALADLFELPRPTGDHWRAEAAIGIEEREYPVEITAAPNRLCVRLSSPVEVDLDTLFDKCWLSNKDVYVGFEYAISKTGVVEEFVLYRPPPSLWERLVSFWEHRNRKLGL